MKMVYINRMTILGKTLYTQGQNISNSVHVSSKTRKNTLIAGYRPKFTDASMCVCMLDWLSQQKFIIGIVID